LEHREYERERKRAIALYGESGRAVVGMRWMGTESRGRGLRKEWL